jgi:hypothetical protein
MCRLSGLYLLSRLSSRDILSVNNMVIIFRKSRAYKKINPAAGGRQHLGLRAE